MTSIKRRTALWVGVALSVLLATMTIGVDLALRRYGQEELDRLLRVYGHAVGAQIEADAGRHNPSSRDLRAYPSQDSLPYFSYAVWSAEGKLVTHAGSLDEELLQPVSEVSYARPFFFSRRLPSGRRIRVAQMDLRVSHGADGAQAHGGGEDLPDWLRPQLTLIAAADWRDTEGPVMALQKILAGTLMGSALLASLLVWYSIGKGLRPIARLGMKLQSFMDNNGPGAP